MNEPVAEAPAPPEPRRIKKGDRVVPAPGWGFEGQNGDPAAPGICIGPSNVDPNQVAVVWMHGLVYRYDPVEGRQLRLASESDLRIALRRIAQLFTKEELQHAAQEET